MSCPKESVFVPCGHRCVCYDCGMGTFSKYGKCPLCQTKAVALLKKVFD